MPRKAAPAVTTPCPRCAQPLVARGEKAVCPACGQAVRFVDAPLRPCVACAAPVPQLPGQDALRCATCGAWQAADPGRPIEARATCPRCRRSIVAPLQGAHAACPHCHSVLGLKDTDRPVA